MNLAVRILLSPSTHFQLGQRCSKATSLCCCRAMWGRPRLLSLRHTRCPMQLQRYSSRSSSCTRAKTLPFTLSALPKAVLAFRLPLAAKLEILSLQCRRRSRRIISAAHWPQRRRSRKQRRSKARCESVTLWLLAASAQRRKLKMIA